MRRAVFVLLLAFSLIATGGIAAARAPEAIDRASTPVTLEEAVALAPTNVSVQVVAPKVSGPSTDASVGLGWYIYLRFSPQEQRFILQAGTGAVAVLVCAVSAGTACWVAGVAAAVIVAWIAEFYNPTCWVEIRLTYTGRFAGGNRCWKRA